jgi:AraC-like DNA-binding protein
MNDIILLINCIVLIHLVVFSVLLHIGNSATYNIKILSLVLVTHELSMILGAIKFSSYEHVFRSIIYLEVIFYINAIIVYYFYIRLYLGERINLKKKFLHLLFPILFILINTILLLFFPTVFQKILNYRDEYNKYFEWDVLFSFIYAFVYCIACLKLIYKRKKELKKLGQYKHEAFFWIKVYTWFIAVVIVGSVFSELFSSVLGYCVYIYVLIYLFFVISITVIIIRSIPKFILKNNIALKKHVIPLNEKHFEYENLILKAIQKNKIYLDKELSLNKFAANIDLPSHVVSDIIRSRYQKNFNQFINDFRITEAKELLVNSNNANFTIDAISEMSGFKSRSSFYNSFKNATGVSPVIYRKKYS